MHKKIYTLIISTLFISLLSGCVLNVETDRRTRGALWNDSDLGSIQRGETSTSWVLEAIGEPTRKITTSQGTEIWQFVSHRVEETEVGFIFLFHIDVENDETRQLNVEIDNGTVVDYWIREFN